MRTPENVLWAILEGIFCRETCKVISWILTMVQARPRKRTLEIVNETASNPRNKKGSLSGAFRFVQLDQGRQMPGPNSQRFHFSINPPA
jgi:hypothetical protein